MNGKKEDKNEECIGEDKRKEAQQMDQLRDGKKHKRERVSLSEKEYNKLKEEVAQAKEFYEKLLRLSAEFENTKKRLIREKDEFKKFANENLLSKLLSIVDNFDRAIETSKKTENLESLIEGIKIVQFDVHKLLEENGVNKIKAVGEEFNPNYHEAIMTIDSDKYSEDTVIEEIQTGYTLNGRLLRPAIVKIAKRTP